MTGSAQRPRMHYVDTRQGQVHVRSWIGPDANAPIGVCLHPVPYSGRYFHNFAACLRERCHVLAIDLPGYGGSTPTDQPISIEDHAAAVADALEEMGTQIEAPGGFMPIGFHTGSGVGGELALARPDLISRVVFVTYPYVELDRRPAMLEEWKHPPPIPGELQDLESRWSFTIGNRAPEVTLADAFDYFAEQLRTADRFWHGFDAMFNYAAEQRLPAIQQPTLIVNPPDALHEMTRNAAALMPEARVIETDFGKKAIFDAYPQRLADLIGEFAAD